MPDLSSESRTGMDSMLGAFCGNVSQRAFESVGKNIDGLDDKFKRLNSSASSGFQTLRAGTDRLGEAVASEVSSTLIAMVKDGIALTDALQINLLQTLKIRYTIPTASGQNG